MAEQPASEAQAVAERDRLLHDVRLYLAALTGQETGSTHPTLVALERNADAIRDGLRMLYLERDQRGLSWSNSMHRLIAALETHYAVLEQIRNELAELEYRSPPSAPPSAAADEPADEPAGEPADDNP